MILKRLLKISKWFFSFVLSICLITTIGLYIFQDEIIASVLEEVNSNLETPIETSDVELTFWSSFPNLEVNLKDVYIKDSHKEQSNKDTLMYSENINLTFSPFDFIDGKYNLKSVEISPGVLNLFTDSMGGVNYDIIKKTDEESDFIVKLKNIAFDHFKINYQNDLTNQHFSTNLKQVDLSGDLSNEKFDLSTVGEIYLSDYTSYQVSLIKDKKIECDVKIKVDQSQNRFYLEPSEIKIETLPFTCFGSVQQDSLKFSIESKDILISEMVKELVSKEKADLTHLKGEGKVDFKINLYGGTKASDPTLIACNFNVIDGSLIEPYKGTKLKAINLEGLYSNVGGQEEEKIEIKNFSCQSISGPFQGNFTMKNFKNPRIFGKAIGNLDLNVIQNLFRIKSVKKMKGLLNLNTKFDFLRHNKKSDIDLKSVLADMEFINSSISLHQDNRELKKLNGKISYNGKDLLFNNLNLKIGSSDMKIKGKLLAFMENMKGKTTYHPEITVTSDLLNLDELFDSDENETKQTTEFILPDIFEGSIQVKANNLIYDKLHYDEFQGVVHLNKHLIEIKKSKFVHAGSTWTGDISLKQEKADRIDIGGDLKTKNTDLKTLFENWDNFGQDIVTSQNIVSGQSDLELKFLFPFNLINDDFDYNKINAQFKVKIPRVQLSSVSLFSEMTKSLKENSAHLLLGNENINYLDSKLKNVVITDFSNTISINHGNIVLPKMDIRSSAINLELTAIHGFNDIIDYRVVLPYRDLIINEKETKYGIVEKEGNGLSLFLKVFGHLDDLTFKWDKKRHRKEVMSEIKKQSNEIKSILKSEFGMFSKKKEIKKFQEPKRENKPVIKLNFNQNEIDQKTDDDIQDEDGNKKEPSNKPNSKNKKKGLLKRTIQSWKNESEKEKEKTQFTVGG